MIIYLNDYWDRQGVDGRSYINRKIAPQGLIRMDRFLAGIVYRTKNEWKQVFKS